MTCLDWGLNGALFFGLFPLTLMTIDYRSALFRGTLWLAWSGTLMLDLALFVSAYSWRNYAFAVCALLGGYCLLLLALDSVSKIVELLTWEQSYNWAVRMAWF